MRIILYNIRSIHNVGSIFRTADALGCIEKIYLCGITPAPTDELGRYRGAFSKTALGAEKTISWEKKGSASVLLKKIRKENKAAKILAIEQAKGSTPYYQYRVKGGGLENIVLILGDEIKGIPSSVLGKADIVLEIPMGGNKESLNVAIAFGVVSFYIKYNHIKH